jgi:hypothetical protein
MAVFVSVEVPGQTPEGYDAMLEGLEPLIRSAPGFICRSAYSENGTWHVLEMWESNQAATAFFARYVHPNLPPGIKPRRELHELHSCVLPSRANAV